MRIEVTAEDIANGTPYDKCSCPVALACLRAGLLGVIVVPAGAIHWLDGEGRSFAKPTPDDARSFAIRFDRRQAVEPFAFDLDVTP